MNNANLVFNIELSRESELKAELIKRGLTLTTGEQYLWRASGKNLSLTLYKSGKLLIQGNNSNQTREWLIEKNLVGNFKTKQKKWIGTDEAGKGDYFGPLIIASVLVDKSNQNRLWDIGVKDSKSLSDNTIRAVAKKIKEICQNSIVVISPKKYNELIAKMRNLNKLLAWGHARAIENILEKEKCDYALSDQFGDKRFIESALLKKGKKITVEQRPKAEKDIAVAAASILARNELLTKFDEMSTEYSMKFPKGSPRGVIQVGQEFISLFGKDNLENVAKLHFKTTLEVIK